MKILEPPLPRPNFLSLPNELLIKILILSAQTPLSAIKLSHINTRIASLYHSEKSLTMHLDLLFIRQKRNLDLKLKWFVERVKGRLSTLLLDVTRLSPNYAELFPFGLKGTQILLIVELKALQIHDGTEMPVYANFTKFMSLVGPNLTKLSLSSVDGLSVDFFNVISTKFKDLQILELYQCLGSRAVGNINETTVFRNLETLIIDDVNFAEAIIPELLQKTPNLTRLTYSGHVTAKTVYNAAGNIPKLKSLTIQDIQVEGDDHVDFEEFCKSHEELREVFLSTPTGLYYPKEYLLAMGKYLPRLETLFIDSLDINDEFLAVVIKEKKFQKVQVTACPSITSAGFQMLFNCLDKKAPLRLEFSRCMQFDDSTMESLATLKNINSLRLFGNIISVPVMEIFIKSQNGLEMLHLSNVYSQDELARLSGLMPKHGKIRLSISKMFD